MTEFTANQWKQPIYGNEPQQTEEQRNANNEKVLADLRRQRVEREELLDSYRREINQAWEQAVYLNTRYNEKDFKAKQRKARAKLARKERHEAMLSIGLVRVRGALGGTYYE